MIFLNLMENEIANISLSKLSEIEDLTVRTQNICEYNSLKDLYSILYYYFENGDFSKLRNCGPKSNLELINICCRYEKTILNQKDDSISENSTQYILEKIHSLTINQYKKVNNFIKYQFNQLSVRSSNALNKCLLSNIDLVGIELIFSNQVVNFRNLPYIGEKSIVELNVFLELIQDYIKLVSNDENESAFINSTNPNLRDIDSLTSFQKAILNNFIESQFNELSARSQNALKIHLKNDITLKSFDQYILSDSEFQIEDLRCVGHLTKSEVNSFLLSIKEHIEFVSNLKDEYNIEIELFNSFFKQYFNVNNNIIKEIVNDYDLSNGIPIFKIIKGLVDNDIILDRQERIIFYNEFCFSTTKEAQTLDMLGTRLCLTKERVRQIRRHLLHRFDKLFRFTIYPEVKSLIKYGADLTNYYLDISEDLIQKINVTEVTTFNRLFILRIFAIIHSDKYDLIGKLEQITNQRSNDLVNWKKCYIVDKHITSMLNFNMLINDVHNRLSSRIEEDYILNFQSYLFNFRKTNDFEELDLIAEIAEYILFNEFEISVNSDDCIVFAKNTKVQIIDCIYEALEKMKEPQTIYELYNIIEHKYPGLTKSADSLRGCCQGDQNLFFIGRSSTYGLKIWENDINIKGGTIRDIVEEYLQNQTEPKHIDEITEYVNNYRDTNSKSIFANLHMDESKRFVFFGGMLIGITNKEYSTEKYLLVKELPRDRKTWEEMFICLQKFVEENDRIPCSTGSESETKLYRFMKSQLNKSNVSEIVNAEISKIFELVSKYNYKKKKRHTSSNLKESYSELREFVLKNERLPRANYNNEKILYCFFYRQRKLFLEQSISIEFIEKFIEIANLLNHKI